MPTTPTIVKGIKYGTLAQYNALASHDADTLYFITDKGLLYRGSSIVVPRNFTTTSKTGSGASEKVHFRVETYGNDPANPAVLEFDVYTKAAVDAALATINTAITTHAGTLATSRIHGHVELSDAIDDDTHNADYSQTQGANEAVAASPYAVYLALRAANQYTDQQIASIAGAMLFKGTIGDAEAYSSSSAYAVGDYCTYTSDSATNLYRCTSAIAEGGETWNADHWTQVDRTVSSLPAAHTVGWTYRVVAPGTYAGKPCEVGDLIICVTTGTAANNDHWTVAQNNIDGAVTTSENLDSDCLVLGNGEKTVKKLGAGQTTQFLRQSGSGPEWATVAPSTIGDGYGYATRQGATSNFNTDLPSGMPISSGSIIALRFSADVPASAKLKVGNLTNTYIYHQGAQLAAGVIRSGDTAVFVYGSMEINNVTYTGWHLISIDRQAPSNLGSFTNDIIARATCNVSAQTAQKDVTIAAYTVAAGSILSVLFTNDVGASSTICVNSGTPAAIRHRGAAILADVIRGGDTATFVYDGTYWHLVGIDKTFDATPDAASHNLVDSAAVYNFVDSRTLYWSEMS